MIHLYLLALAKTIDKFFTWTVFKTVLKSIVWSIFFSIFALISLHFIVIWLTQLSIFSGLRDYIWFADIGVLVLFMFSFPAVLIAVSSFYIDDIIEMMEKEYGIERKFESNFLSEFLLATKLFLLTLFVNLLALPFYLIPILNIFVFPVVNSLLISYEYFYLIASRYFNKSSAKMLRQTYYGHILIAAFVIVLSMYVPLLNLLVPVLGALYMGHFLYLLKSFK